MTKILFDDFFIFIFSGKKYLFFLKNIYFEEIDTTHIL